MSSIKKLQRVLIMAGGTGGHVFPGLAIAKALQAKGVEIFWLGTPRGLEAQLVPAESITFMPMTITGLRGKHWLEQIKAPWRMLSALGQALRHIRAIKPDLVIGMGGFVSGPGGLAAWLLRKPLVIHEQNAIAGLTNRLLAKLAGRVLEGFPQTFPANVGAIYTGNPVRTEISLLAEPGQRYQQPIGPLRLLVLGGSLGAAAINTLMPSVLAQINNPLSLEVKHQTGQAHFATTQAQYAKLAIPVEVTPFITDMAAAYDWADIVLCRAGALTIAELMAAGKPALLIPFPHAVDDHQTKNGQFLVAAGAALMLPQHVLSMDSLLRVLQLFLQERTQLQTMAIAAKTLFKETATENIVAICEQYSGSR